MDLNSKLDIDSILAKINTSTSKLISSGESSILLFNDEKLSLYFKAKSPTPQSSVLEDWRRGNTANACIHSAPTSTHPCAMDDFVPSLHSISALEPFASLKRKPLLRAQRRRNEAEDLAPEIPVTDAIAWWVAQTGEPAIVNDTSFDPRFTSTADSIKDFKTKSILCVPVILAGEIIGVLEAINEAEGNAFTETDLNLFSALADVVAGVIRNAQMLSVGWETRG